MRGLDVETVPYVLNRDQNEEPEYQTRFHIKLKSGLDAGRMVSRYSAAEKVAGARGYRNIDESRWRKADAQEWLDTVSKVENFCFGNKYPDLAAQGWIAEISDPDTLIKVAKSITLNDYNEIMDFAAEASQLSNVSKKD